MNIWSLLGIEPTGDQRTIKRAYAKLLKRTNPEDDPEGFQRLRDAYEQATLWAQRMHDVYPDLQAAEDQEAEDKMGMSPVGLTQRPVSPNPPHDHAGNGFRPKKQYASFGDRRPPQSTEPMQVPTDNPVVRDLLAVAKKQGIGAAIRTLQAIQRMPELEHLDRRDEFEEALLLQIAQDKEVPLDFVREVSNHFGWEKHGSYMRRRHPDVIGEILQRIGAKQPHREPVANKQSIFSEQSPFWPKLTDKRIFSTVLAIGIYVLLIYEHTVPILEATVLLLIIVFRTVIAAMLLLVVHIKKLWLGRVFPTLRRLDSQLTEYTFGRILPRSVGAGLKFRHFLLALFLAPFTYFAFGIWLPEGQIKDEFLYAATYFSALAVLILYFQLKSRSKNFPLISNAMALTGYYGWNIVGWVIGITGLSVKNGTLDVKISAALALLICIFWARNAMPHPKSLGVYFIMLWVSFVISVFWSTKFPQSDGWPGFVLLLLLGVLTIYTMRLGLLHVRIKK